LIERSGDFSETKVNRILDAFHSIDDAVEVGDVEYIHSLEKRMSELLTVLASSKDASSLKKHTISDTATD
jgi:hypothetical protein